MDANTLLVGTDFSEASVWMAHHAAEMAKRLKLEFELVHIIDPKDHDSAEKIEATESRLEDVREDLEAKWGIQVDTETLSGSPGKRLVELSRSDKYAMVALGYHGRSGVLSRIGSVTAKLVREVDKPILVLVPSHHNEGPIIGCIDFSDQTEKINEWTLHMAALQSKDPVFTHVAVPFETIVAATPNMGGLGLAETVFTRMGTSEESYRKRIEASVRHRLGDESRNEVEILLSLSPSRAISEYARKRNAGLVVLGRHGHNTLGARLMGSTAERILEQSHTSVLVLP